MTPLATLITRVGDYLVSLSDGTRKWIAITMMLVLGGGGIYKLVVSLDKLNDPLPVASPQQLIDPMQDLFQHSKDKVFTYQQARKREMSRLDSLKIQFSKKPNSRP